MRARLRFHLPRETSTRRKDQRAAAAAAVRHSARDVGLGRRAADGRRQLEQHGAVVEGTALMDGVSAGLSSTVDRRR